MPAAVLLSPWQTGSHNLRRTYCKTSLANPECWCSQKREDWVMRKEPGRSCRTPLSRGPPQAAQSQFGYSTWPLPAAGQGGQEAETSSAVTGLETASHCVQQLVHNKQTSTDAHSWAKSCQDTRASLLRHQSPRAHTATEYHFNHGRRCSPAVLLGDGHCPPAT